LFGSQYNLHSYANRIYLPIEQ
jgi:hypothetical protein